MGHRFLEWMFESEMEIYLIKWKLVAKIGIFSVLLLGPMGQNGHRNMR